MNTIINLFLADISHASNTSGVDRHISTLIGGLRNMSHIRLHWIHLTDDETLLFPKEEHTDHYVKLSIPLPQFYHIIIAENFWILEYNKQVYRLTQHLFEGKENCIIHMHTLNLINLATYIREREHCKIITHLHCIPWKGLYNKDKKRFNRLYEAAYTQIRQMPTGKSLPDMYITNKCELQSYLESDVLICVTNCAVDFIRRYAHKKGEKIYVIPNGIGDFFQRSDKGEYKTPQQTFRCLYVGVLSESKGLGYILKALRIVQRHGYKVSLSIAGACSTASRQKLMADNPDLKLDVKGLISFDELKTLYSESDIGIISSLQEQSSYVAIEMAMSGLPIITTAIDGLDEIFTDELDALKVNTLFSPIFGLSADVEKMASQLMRIINDRDLRIKLGTNARKLYENSLNIDLMVNRIARVYNELI